MKPDKIISGGQTGADSGALVGAVAAGIATGGTMPKGYRTELGPNPDFARRYGLQEHRSAEYPPRTKQNVRDADGTIWVGPHSTYGRGYRCTVKEVERQHKPFLDNPDAATLRVWVEQHQIRVLNVAGPTATHDSKAFERAASLIIAAFGD